MQDRKCEEVLNKYEKVVAKLDASSRIIGYHRVKSKDWFKISKQCSKSCNELKLKRRTSNCTNRFKKE